MSDYATFYGGRNGAAFIIKRAYKSVQEMVDFFKQGDAYTEVKYDEYVLIDSADSSSNDNGKIYRRGYDIGGTDEQNNDTGGAVYIGRVAGARGYGFLAVRNFDPNLYPQVETKQGTVDFLNQLYPNGYEDDEGLHMGWLITTGTKEGEKLYYYFNYALDIQGKYLGWTYLGTFNDPSIIIGDEDDEEIISKAQQAVKNSVWLITNDISKPISVTFSPLNIPEDKYRNPSFYNGIWVIGSDTDNGLFWSEDGVNWNQSNVQSGQFFAPSNLNGLWIAGEYKNNGIYFSNNGKEWQRSNITNYGFRQSASNQNITVIGSNHGIYYSTDGKTWDLSNYNQNSYWNVMTFNNIFVCSEQQPTNGLHWSADGMVWQATDLNSGDFNTPFRCDDILVASAYANADGIFWSQNGITWHPSNITNFRYLNGFWYNHLGVIGSFSGQGLFYSLDGKEWQQTNIKTGNFQGVYCYDGLWVATSISGQGLFYSLDGKEWQQTNIKTGSSSYAYCYNGKWLVCSIFDNTSHYYGITNYST